MPHHTHHSHLNAVGQRKMARVMREFYAGHLHSGSTHGPLVMKPQQARAIGESEAHRAEAIARHRHRHGHHGH